MSKTYNKPFLDFPDLIKLMRSRNIDANHTALTYEVLESISYYNLVNGYKHSFLSNNGKDIFKYNTKFEHLYHLHLIDLSLSNILFKYILLLEKSLKTKVSHIVAKDFGVDEQIYLDKNNYSNSTKQRTTIVRDLKKLYLNPHNKSSTHHYKNTKNHIPPWIIASDMPFGLSIKWYSILRDSQKTYVCDRFLKCYQSDICSDERKELLKKSLDLLKNYRNHTAHGRRTFNNNITTELPKNPLLKIIPNGVLSETEYISGIGKNDFYAVLILIIILINDTLTIKLFLNDLELTISTFSEFKFNNESIESILKLPENYIERLKILSEDKFNRIEKTASIEFI